MFYVAKAKRQLQMFYVAKAKRQLQMFYVAKAKRQLQVFGDTAEIEELSLRAPHLMAIYLCKSETTVQHMTE